MSIQENLDSHYFEILVGLPDPVTTTERGWLLADLGGYIRNPQTGLAEIELLEAPPADDRQELDALERMLNNGVDLSELEFAPPGVETTLFQG